MDIGSILTMTRKSQIPYWEKARKFARELRKLGCSVQVLDCDVCIEILFPDFIQTLEKYKEDLASLEKVIPKKAKVRIHAETPKGYLTYCFYCDLTMCGNEFEYSDEPDWDKIHLELTRNFLLEHPEWEVEDFMLSGSTRHTAWVDVVCPEEMLYHAETVKGVRVVVHSVFGALKGREKIFNSLPWIRIK